MQDFCLFFYLLLIFVIFCKNNRSNGSEIRHKKCFFALFLFFVHLRQILSTFVSCSGRQAGASSFIVPDVIRLFSSFSDGYYPPLFYIFLAFYSIFLAFYSIFLHFFFKIHANFPFFLAHSIFLYYFCTLIRFRLFPTVTRRSPDSHPTVDRRLNDDEVSVNRQ